MKSRKSCLILKMMLMFIMINFVISEEYNYKKLKREILIVLK